MADVALKTSFTTTVNGHDVRDDVTDHITRDDFDALSRAGQQRFLAELERIHQARVALESLPPDAHQLALGYLDAHDEVDDFERLAGLFLGAIRYATEP